MSVSGVTTAPGWIDMWVRTINGVPPPFGPGDVMGPASSVNNHVASFNGTTGKIIKDSGVTITGPGTISGTNTGDVTLTAFGAAPNANGASLAGQALTLQPASATQPGGVTTAAQSFAGAKFLTGGLQLNTLDVTYAGDSNTLVEYESNVTGVGQFWSGPWAVAQGPHAFRWERIGNLKIVTIQGFQATPGGMDALILSTVNLPAYMYPATNRAFQIDVINNAAGANATAVITTAGFIQIGVGYFTDLAANPPTFTAANYFSAAAGGNHGLFNWQFVYV